MNRVNPTRPTVDFMGGNMPSTANRQPPKMPTGMREGGNYRPQQIGGTGALNVPSGQIRAPMQGFSQPPSNLPPSNLPPVNLPPSNLPPSNIPPQVNIPPSNLLHI